MFQVAVGSRGVAWVGANHLSGDTARDLLHLLHHLGQETVYFWRVSVELLRYENWEVNPVVAALLKRPEFRLRAESLHSPCSPIGEFADLVDYKRLVELDREMDVGVGGGLPRAEPVQQQEEVVSGGDDAGGQVLHLVGTDGVAVDVKGEWF